MKKGKKTALIVAGAIVLLLIAFVTVGLVVNGTREKNRNMYYDRLHAGDVAGAMEYAQKLDTSSTAYPLVDDVETLGRFLELYDTGEWQQAIDVYDGGGQYAGTFFINRGKPLAAYVDCHYQLVVPKADEALQSGDVTGAIELLLQFQYRFHDGAASNGVFDKKTNTHLAGSYSEYEEYFPKDAQHYFDTVCAAGEAALSSGDESAIALLSGFYQEPYTKTRTYKFDSFTWAADYAAWQAGKEAEAAAEKDAEAAAQEAEALALPEGGGSGSCDSTGMIALKSADSGLTYRLLSFGMVQGGSRFGVYITPVDGELSRITGKDQFGNPKSQVLVQALAVDAEGNAMRPVSTNSLMDMTDPSKSRMIFLFDAGELPQSLFLYPTDDKEGGALITLGEISPEKMPEELIWE